MIVFYLINDEYIKKTEIFVLEIVVNIISFVCLSTSYIYWRVIKIQFITINYFKNTHGNDRHQAANLHPQQRGNL